MPRIRLVVFWVVCLGAGFSLVRLAPVAVAAWQLRRHALQLESIRVTADSQGTAGLFPVIEITLRNPAPSLSFLTDRKSTRLNSSHVRISYAVFCLKKKKQQSRNEYDSRRPHL